jgi:hypothetical protein
VPKGDNGSDVTVDLDYLEGPEDFKPHIFKSFKFGKRFLECEFIRCGS